MIHLLLVDDHAVVREGYRRLLERRPDLRIDAEAGSAAQALQHCRERRFDVVVADLSLPDLGGVELVRRLLQRDAETRVLVFSMHRDPLFARQALRAGARGYVTKSAPTDDLVQAIYRVAAGQRALSSDIAPGLALELLDGDDNPLSRLNAREFELLRLLLEGLDAEAIGQRLNVSPKTVQNGHYQIKSTLGVRNDIELVRLAMKWGLLEP